MRYKLDCHVEFEFMGDSTTWIFGDWVNTEAPAKESEVATEAGGEPGE